MTDKQIIIDGVNVSGCDFYDKNKKYCLTLKMDIRGFKNHSCFSGDFQKCIQDSKVCPYTFCENNHNCYYKQLKRKEQKLERITNMLFIGQCSNCEGYSPNCSNKELCNFKHNIKNIIDEVENEN